MSSDSLLSDNDIVTVHPSFGTGWEITVNQIEQQLCMQLKVFGLKLPAKLEIPYSWVVAVDTIARELRWSIAGGRSRYDILARLKGGSTVEITTVSDADSASEIQRKLRHRFGLQEIH